MTRGELDGNYAGRPPTSVGVRGHRLQLPLPQWLDDELNERGWPLLLVAALGLVAAAVIVWIALSSPDAPRPTAAAVSPPAPMPPRMASAVAAAVALPASVSPALPTCPHQFLDLTTSGGLERACVSNTRTHQTGSIRSHVVVAEGTSGWEATVDAVAGEVVSVRLRQAAIGTALERWYVCDGPACQGAVIGAADAHGVHAVMLEDVGLRALPVGERWRRPVPGRRRAQAASAGTAGGGPAATQPVLRLAASLVTQPDAANPAAACAGPSVTVVESRGAVTELCPRGGAGFEIGDDGLTRFLFRDLDGRELAVALAPDHTSIASVSLGALVCHAPQCGGVSMGALGDAADPSVERSFQFSGTTVGSARAGERSATLSGGVTMPAQ